MSKFPFSQILENGVNRMLVVLEDWRNSRIIQLVAILVSILMIVPSADAVDALKTCACLLKECRYAAIPPFFLFLFFAKC